MLEATDLAVTPPGAHHASVRGISLSVRAGDWLALAGENGGGKTSLLLALSGLWPISSGSLTLDGRPFGPGLGEGAAPALAVVLQDPSSQLLQPTVAEELAFTSRNLGAREDEVAREVARWIGALGLEPELARDPATLSAGRQQLVLVAAALVSRPSLLFADEPTAHMDAATRARVRAAIAGEVARGLAVIWATQDDDELTAASRTLVVASKGPASLGGPFSVRAETESGRAPGASPPGLRSPSSDEGTTVLRLEIRPASTEHGPRIRLTRHLTIQIGRRGVTALTGPNGAGKSALLAAIAGLEEVPQAVVHWVAPPARPPIMALQYPELQVFEERVADEIVFAAVARGLDRPAALDAAANHLKHIGFDPERLLDRRTWALSTGEKRLVEVVGALIAPSSLLLLDEPTAGLDSARRAALAGLVRRRAGEGPVMVASQDVGWVTQVGARVYSLGS